MSEYSPCPVPVREKLSVKRDTPGRFTTSFKNRRILRSEQDQNRTGKPLPLSCTPFVTHGAVYLLIELQSPPASGAEFDEAVPEGGTANSEKAGGNWQSRHTMGHSSAPYSLSFGEISPN